MTILKRTIAGAPAAILVTTGLGLLMAGLIKVEYEALNEKPKQLSFTINQIPDDIYVRPPLIVDPVRDVEVPPPPPKIATDPSDLPTIKLVETIVKPPDFPTPDIEWKQASFTVDDSDARPLVRIPPIMPDKFASGNNSGRCAVKFNVSAEGSPFNIQILSCSAKVLERATVKSVLKWRYQPKMVDGQAVMMTGVQDVIVYELLDENGRRLPEL